MKVLAVVLAVLALAGIIALSHRGAAQAEATYKADTLASERKFGPSVTVCVHQWDTKDKNRIKCGTLRTGMTQDEVTAELGDHLHGEGMIESRTTAEGTQETWRFFGSVNHFNYVVTGFDNGILRVIVQ